MHKALIRPAMTYGSGTLIRTEEKELMELDRLERKIWRAATGKYRRPDGRYYSNETLMKELDMKESISEVIMRREEEPYVRRKEHRNEWFRERMDELEGRRVMHKLRNLEYEKGKKEWTELER